MKKSSALFQYLFSGLLFLLPWTAFSQTVIPGGNLTSNTTWTAAGSPYVIENSLTVSPGVILNIEPGVIVKFTDHFDHLVVEGSLRAQGLSEQPVVFTSLLDDGHGGDTNGDGNATQAAPDQWGAIWFSASSTGNVLNNCWIGYGGGYATSAMINTADCDVRIENSTIAHSMERGLYSDEAAMIINNNHFVGNGTDGIHFYGLHKTQDVVLSNNTFVDNVNFAAIAILQDEQVDISLFGNSSTGSAHNGFALTGTIAGTMQWRTSGNFPFVVWDDVAVTATGTLHVYEGSIVKFNDHYDDLVVYGSLRSLGSSGTPVYFTSISDDMNGGDTNGDAGATQADGNQWGAIWFDANSTNNLMEFTFIGYGGGYATSAMMNIYTSEVSMINCTISTSAERGVFTRNASPVFQNCNFVDNGTDGIYFEGLDKTRNLVLENNAFTRNTNFAALARLIDEERNITLLRNAGSGSAHNGFAVYGSITGDAHWQSNDGFPFVIWDDVAVQEGASLSLGAGTTVKFNDHYDDIVVNGSLTAAGTAMAPVVFTALADDSFDGDTNSDGAATQPAPANWGAIWLGAPSSNNRFSYTYFGYGGGYATTAMLNVYTSDTEFNYCNFASSAGRGVFTRNASPGFQNSNFINNTTDGIYFEGLDKVLDLVMTDNTFTGNTNFAVLARLMDEERSIILTGNSSTGSSHNGFAVYGTIAGTLVWTSNPSFPFVIWEDVNIMEFAQLTISEGSTVKFNDHFDDLFVNGSLQAAGLEGQPVTFTAIADDSVDGDTNGDADASAPAPDQWGAIWFSNTSYTSDLRYCFVGYGGGYATSAMINILGVDDVIIQNSILTSATDRAVYVDGAYPTLEMNRIHNNNVGLFTTNKALPILLQNDVYNNTAYGIQNGDFSVEVDAWNTWWGDVTGPEHPVLNPGGQGNPVSDHVLFQPWMEQSNTGLSTGLVTERILPFALEQIAPNPFKERLQVSFYLDAARRVQLEVYGSDGQLIERLLDEQLPPGAHQHEWQVNQLPAGQYWIRLRGADGQVSQLAVRQ